MDRQGLYGRPNRDEEAASKSTVALSRTDEKGGPKRGIPGLAELSRERLR